MTIYTKKGDDGTTGCADGRRISKADALCEALGDLDELSAQLGLSQAAAAEIPAIADALAPCHVDLLACGAMLNNAATESKSSVVPGTDAVSRLELAIDATSQQLSPLEHFVIPGGCELACRLHVARTVCRRAERTIVSAQESINVPAEMLAYINRLSDLLFVLARLANHCAGVDEHFWRI